MKFLSIKTLLFLVVLSTMSVIAYGQTGIQKANALYDKLSYDKAIPQYLSLAKSKNDEAIIKLANCYRLTNDNRNAEQWYKEAVKLSIAEPINKLYYAEALMNSEQYNEAKYWLNEYLNNVPSDKRAKNLLDACSNIRAYQQNNSSYEVYQLPFPINTDKSEIGPMIFKGNLIYSSDHDSLVVRNAHTWTGRTFYEIYSSSVSGDASMAKYGKPTKIKNKQTLTKYHEGPVCFTADGSRMIFTRNNYVPGQGAGKDNEGTIRLKLFIAELNGEQWTADKGTEMSFNSDQYSCAHPALSADGSKLYFASDMPGGYGGMDLYVANRSGNGYSNPVNLGPSINTEGDDMFPFIDQNGTMYFASNGQPGMGGLDIFSADGEGTSWSGVTNLGSPINTSKDDFGYVLDNSGEWGYLASNRNERRVGDDDIYSFKRCVVKMTGIVVDKYTEEPIGGATVNLEEYGKGLGTVKTGNDGKFSYNVGCNRDYKVCGSKEGYGEAVCKSVHSGSDARIPLFVKIPLEKAIVRSPCTLSGIVIDKTTRQPIANANVKVTSFKDLVTLHTDGSGRFSMAAEPNITYSLTASADGYFVDSDVKNLGDCNLNSNGSGDVQLELGKFDDCKMNLDNILYDLDKYYLRPESKVELDKVVDWMNQNPSIRVELQSHTDCRASMSYNQKLSQNRSNSCVDYIVSRGISKSRIVAKGYGETQLLNDCACEPGNKSNCSESEHQINRRTVIKILDCNK